MSDIKAYLFVNKSTGSLEFKDFPYPEREQELLQHIYSEYAFEPLDRTTLEKMNRTVADKMEAWT
ncbi:MAG: hypothetical protein PQJ59_10370 [Spirochaetales bacterium]|nr:hypothetical protein [Spirochaetales bacterium]